MKKAILSMVAVMATAPMFAQENVGLDQFSVLTPAPGYFSLDSHEGGFNGVNFAFAEGKGEVNRSADIFITLKRNGNVISNIPASNTAQIKFDSAMSDVWQLVFFPNSSFECFAGGSYEVTIPANLFTFGDKGNSEVVINYDMTLATDTPTIFPAESKQMAELKEFVLTFPTAQSVAVNPDAAHKPELINLFGGSDDEDGEAETYNFNISIEGNAVTLALSETITKGSVYNIIIPEGSFTLTDANGASSPCREYAYQYGIPKVGLGQPSIFPDSNIILDFPGVIELSLQPEETLVFVNNMGKNAIRRVNEDGTLGEEIADYRAASKGSKYYKDENGNLIPENANKVYLVNRLGEDVHICPFPGRYQLITSGGLYTIRIDGAQSSVDPFTYNYEVVDGNLFDMEFTPSAESTVAELKEIQVKFPYADEIKIEWATAKFSSKTTNYLFYPNSNVENNTVTFSTSVPVTMEGNYRFISDLKSVCIDGDYVGIMVDYTISKESGVKEVCNPVVLPATFDIYNAQGILMKKSATMEELNALPAGIYIAGGHKIINR